MLEKNRLATKHLIRPATFFLVLWCLIFPSLVHPQGLPRFETQEIIIFHEPGLEKAARWIAEIYPGIKREIEDFFRIKWESRPTVVLLRKERFRETTGGSPGLVAYAIPKRGLVVFNYSALRRSEAGGLSTLKHELCHLVVHHLVGGKQVPRWLDEGICQVVSGTLGELGVDLRGSPMDQAVRAGRLLRFESLTTRFPPSQREMILAYEQSKAFVSYLLNSFGKEGLLALLDLMARGVGEREAISQVYGHNLGELQAIWHETLTGPEDFLASLSYYLYEILFGIGALLMLFAFLVQVVRKRRSYRELEEAEGEQGQEGE